MNCPPGNDIPVALFRQAARLVDRLERLSADSPYAHQASGIRGALLKELDCSRENDDCESADIPPVGLTGIHNLMDAGSRLLLLAAREIPAC